MSRRYQAAVVDPEGSSVLLSPLYRRPEYAWQFALGVAEGADEHMHTRRELEGNAELDAVFVQTEGDRYIYRVDPVEGVK